MTTPHAFAIPGDTRFRRHEHHGAHVCVVLDGGFIEREKCHWRDVGPGTVRVSGAARHDIDFSPTGATCLVLEVDEPEIRRLSAARFIESDETLGRLARKIRRASDVSCPAQTILTENLTVELVAQITRRIRGRASPPPPWLERIRDMLHDHRGSVRVSALADEAGVHRVHLARSFRDHYGVPVTRYAGQLRLRYALDLLATESDSLAQLAAHAGFADQSHLTRVVRAATGSTPAALRSMLRPFKT